jgi:2-polyprenyl-6-methoxyphenol hydroxylase-like FAD-dependent oxidoreductase
VLVAGAGPTGLTLAAGLAARGIEVAVCEASAGPGRESSRATTVHAGSLELLDELGVGRRLAESGMRALRSRIFRGRRLLVDQDWTRLPSRYPFLLNLPQEDVETVLRERLRELGGRVHFGWSVAGHRADSDEVSVELRGGETSQSARCRILVGCDGAHSSVRRHLGLHLEGETYPGVFALADAEIAGPLDPECSWLGGSHGGLLGLLPLSGGRWRINATLDDSGEPDDDAPIDFEALAHERLPGLAFRITAVGSSARYKIHRRAAGAMWRGRVLLAGDAAHLNSPIGGQGMNRGFREALDLSWRLPRVLAGEHETLLSEWERERRRDAARVLAGTDRLTRMLRAVGPAGVLTELVLPIASRLLPLHDRVVSTLAQLAESRRIRARLRAGNPT